MTTPATVVVLARNPAAAREICRVAAMRAAVSGRPATFAPLPVDISSEADLAAGLRDAAPTGLLLVASHQSPWERIHAPSQWTRLLEHAGFGLTLPLQADLAIRVGRALHRARPDAWFLNGCFPDGVNPVLASWGIPVLAGIGNVSLLAASLQAALGLPDQDRLRVLAHHVHLHAPAAPEHEARAWLDDKALPDVTGNLRGQRATRRSELNQVTGHAAALLIRTLLTGTGLLTSLPGPHGLPGGYPVGVHGGHIRLRLPTGITREAAVAENLAASARDGVVVDSGRVTFSGTAAAHLARHASALAGGFGVADLPDACRQLLDLRTTLRRQSPDREERP